MKPSIELIAHRPVVSFERPTTLQLLVRVLPPVVKGRSRPKMNIALAIDRSGSMGGQPLEQAKAAAKLLIDALEPGDQLSVVTFDEVARVVIPRTQITNKGRLKAQISAIDVGGATNLHQGWLEACHQIGEKGSASEVRRVLVLSDGNTNVGLQCTDSICSQVADWERRGVGTSTIGLGLHYDEELLSLMSTSGGGNFFHAKSAEELEPFFCTELYGLSLIYGTQAGLSMKTKSGVQALRLYNALANRPDGSVRLTDLVYGYPKEVVFELSVPAMRKSTDICEVLLDYIDRESGKRHRVTATLQLPTIEYARLDEFCINTEVMQKRAIQIAARQLKVARQQLASREYDQAKEALEDAIRELCEAEPSPELTAQMQEIESMLAALDRREYASVQKAASFQSVSTSSSSITLCGTPISLWSKLPPEERTQERLMEMFRDAGLL